MSYRFAALGFYLFLDVMLSACRVIPFLPDGLLLQPPVATPRAPGSNSTQNASESTSILENSKQALLGVKTLRMKSVWVSSTSTTEEKITFVSPDRYRATMTSVCSNGVEWESVHIGDMSYTRCPPNQWRSQRMQIDPPHVRLINTFWNYVTPVGAISRKAIGTDTILIINTEFLKPNGETGTISFEINAQSLLPSKLEIERVIQNQKSVGTIEFSDFNFPMTIPEPNL